jgi:hypothetical protein
MDTVDFAVERNRCAILPSLLGASEPGERPLARAPPRTDRYGHVGLLHKLAHGPEHLGGGMIQTIFHKLIRGLAHGIRLKRRGASLA